MNLSLKSFGQLVQDMGAALQGSASVLVDVSVGSVTRALFEANASVVLWIQWLLLQVLQTTRAATSSGPDLDSWMADYGLTRLPAIPSSGILTFSRYSATFPASVPLGANVKSADATLTFAVTADPTNTLWQPSSSSYSIPSGMASVNLPATCTTGGSVGNVLPGTITIIASSLPGVDQVTNASAFANGLDAESDQAFRTRFYGYLPNLSRATVASVRSAITNVRQGLDVKICENLALNGAPQVGNFLVIVDDGSGEPSSDLIAAVSAAVDSVRPIGTTYSVSGPQVVSVSATFMVSAFPAGVLTTSVVTSVQVAVENYLNSLSIGRSASVTRVAQCAYGANSHIDNVIGITLNGATSDISPGQRAVVKAGTVTVTPYGG